MAFSAGTVLAAASLKPFGVLAGGGGEYEQGKAVPGDYTFEYGTYVACDGDTAYQYATGTDGYAYATSYANGEWSEWTMAGETEVAGDAAPVAYDGKSQAYYTGKDGSLYELTWDSYGDAQWNDVAGGYTFAASPYASTTDETVNLYGTASDGYVYHKGYSDGAWGEWQPLNDAEYPAKTDAKPYGVAWGDHENVFWVGADEKVYWNRYSHADQTWVGAKEIPADYGFSATPYAVGYGPEETLYCFCADAQGTPTWNTFADGDGWSGWQTYEASWSAKGQPNAYVHEETLHVAYTAEDNHGYYQQYSADGWADDWADLGENYGYGTCQYEYEGDLYLTYTGEDGGIYYREFAYDGNGTTDPEPTKKPY